MYKISPKGNVFFLKALKILIIDFSLFFLLFSIFISCKKEQLIVPVLSGEISNPQEGFNCQFGDTILVSGNLSCDYPIQSAFISLVDNNYATVVAGKSLGVSLGNTLNFSVNYALDNLYAPSGDYFLSVNVVSEDQSITLSELRKIHITALPKTTLGNYCIIGSESNPRLCLFDGTFLVEMKSYNFKFLDLKIDSRYKRIYICGKEKVIGLNSADLSEEFQLSPIALNSDSFVSSELFSNQLALSRNDGNIIYYNRDGFRQSETGENIYIRPLLTYSTSYYLYSSVIKNGDRKIAVYFYPSGAPRQELLVDFDIIGFNKISDSEALVFGNRNGSTVIFKYLINGNTVQLLKSIPSTITSSTFSNYSGTIYLLTNGGIVKYGYPANSTITINPGIFSGMNYDEVNDILYCFSGSNIKQLQGTSYADLGNQLMTDSVMAVSVLYSK